MLRHFAQSGLPNTPSSQFSGLTGQTYSSYKTGRPGIYKKQAAGLKRVKVIEWYFYPEHANKKLFRKHKHANVGLKQIAGNRYGEMASLTHRGPLTNSLSHAPTNQASKILDPPADSKFSKAIKSARNHPPAQFVFDNAGSSDKKTKAQEEVKQASHSRQEEKVRLPLTASKVKGGADGLSPYNQPDAKTPIGKASSPLVIVASHRKVVQDAQAQEANSAGQESQDGGSQKANSLYQFQRTELGANFNKVFKNKKLPFKYRTLVYLQKILFSKEVESDIKQFRTKEEKVR